MIYATKIKMKTGCYYHDDLTEIDEIYLQGDGFGGYYKKSIVHDFVKTYPGSVAVNIYPYPKVVDVVSIYGEKYVRSQANSTTRDNLLQLPRE